jgi:hypothetical protein
MTQAKSLPGRITSRDHFEDPIAAVGGHSNIATPRVAKQSRDVRQKIRIDAAPATVFALLTDARRMMTWLARDVMAEPRVGGMFRLADFNGLRIEGIYVELVPA